MLMVLAYLSFMVFVLLWTCNHELSIKGYIKLVKSCTTVQPTFSRYRAPTPASLQLVQLNIKISASVIIFLSYVSIAFGIPAVAPLEKRQTGTPTLPPGSVLTVGTNPPSYSPTAEE